MELLRSLKKQLTKLQLMISKLNLKLKALKLLLNNFIIFEESAILKPWCMCTMAFLYFMQKYVVF